MHDMDALITNEKQLIGEIDKLREQFPHTQDLYREVCILLFFRYGTTPTANKLYQLVRKGSMSAPAEALSKFWTDLREKSRVRIERPDLPEVLINATGELAAVLWATAQEQATQSLNTYREEADTKVAAFQKSTATAMAERDGALQTLQSNQEKAAAYLAKISELEQKLAAERATRNAFEEQLTQAKIELSNAQKRFDDSRKEFASQLDSLRQTAQQAEERFLAAEKRALLEIDRERQTNARAHKELENCRDQAQRLVERKRTEMDALRSQIGDLRQQLGSLESKFQNANEAKNEALHELKAISLRANELANHSVTLNAELHAWRARAETAENTIKNQPEKHPLKRRSKRNET
jgi:chromosome segregation ATPase